MCHRDFLQETAFFSCSGVALYKCYFEGTRMGSPCMTVTFNREPADSGTPWSDTLGRGTCTPCGDASTTRTVSLGDGGLALSSPASEGLGVTDSACRERVMRHEGGGVSEAESTTTTRYTLPSSVVGGLHTPTPTTPVMIPAGPSQLRGRMHPPSPQALGVRDLIARA